MQDLELLTLAAKAVGEQVVGVVEGGVLLYGIQYPWSPLTDDGDALRLAVRLSMTIDIGGDSSEAVTPIHWYVEQHEGDPMAATRRAIVRAAAEIGKQSNAGLSGHGPKEPK